MASIRKRVSRSGDVSYHVQVRLKGFPTQTETFRRLTDARRWAQSTEAAIREGRAFKTREAKRRTAAEMIDRYIETVLPGRLRDGARRARQLGWWKEQLGAFSLAELSPAIIAERRDQLAQRSTRSGTISEATVNRYLAALSHVLHLASSEWGWLESNPMPKVARKREPRGRVRYLTRDEVQRLLASAEASTDPNLHPMVVLALSTGMRRGELLALRWSDLDFDRQRVVAHHTKNGEARGVPLTKHALTVLSAHRPAEVDASGLVFASVRSGTQSFPRKAWVRALAEAGIEDFRFHDLRHTAASYLAMSGASAVQIAEVLGHKTLQMVKRYSHLTEGHTRALVQELDHEFFS